MYSGNRSLPVDKVAKLGSRMSEMDISKIFRTLQALDQLRGNLAVVVVQDGQINVLHLERSSEREKH
jgi:hypothetical protein